MSRSDYEASKLIIKAAYPFYSLIMAAMRQADTDNKHKLEAAFPDVWEELKTRYEAPFGGLLAGDPARSIVSALGEDVYDEYLTTPSGQENGSTLANGFRDDLARAIQQAARKEQGIPT